MFDLLVFFIEYYCNDIKSHFILPSFFLDKSIGCFDQLLLFATRYKFFRLTDKGIGSGFYFGYYQNTGFYTSDDVNLRFEVSPIGFQYFIAFFDQKFSRQFFS